VPFQEQESEESHRKTVGARLRRAIIARLRDLPARGAQAGDRW
jgi:hypothetical protein